MSRDQTEGDRFGSVYFRRVIEILIHNLLNIVVFGLYAINIVPSPARPAHASVHGWCTNLQGGRDHGRIALAQHYDADNVCDILAARLGHLGWWPQGWGWGINRDREVEVLEGAKLVKMPWSSKVGSRTSRMLAISAGPTVVRPMFLGGLKTTTKQQARW